ncbi:MAG: fibronectin/fibrinogen-binding protein [Ruminococcaceae bacterium]|nr:fibronectin/fibrinogen-binding protein [Oscillospiraceae bacterium]
MAFDAGMLSCVLREINEKLEGGKIDKIYQPSHDEVVLLIRSRGGDHRLFINAGSSGARMNITKSKVENPATPPMFCMMLRKHFSGARFHSASQLGFERAARLTFDTHDEMGFATQKHIICEIMGRFSNIIITNAEDKILGVLKSIDFTTSEKRQVLSGMIYELPPKQDKLDPTSDEVDMKLFNKLASCAEGSKSAEKFIISNFAGIAPVCAREIAYRASGKPDGTMDECARELGAKFFDFIDILKKGGGTPYIVRNEMGVPVEYCFMELRQYGSPMEVIQTETFGELIDAYFEERSRDERLHRKAADIFKLLSNAETRITKKMSIQREELSDCDEGEKYKLWGDLITANIYRLKRGMEEAVLENYWSENAESVTIPMDKRLTPSANAQVYYKKYNKSKAARIHLAEQIKLAEEELAYIYTVLDALSRADGERELAEIREELYHSGYASKMKNYTEKKAARPLIAEYETTDGHTVLVGKNNIANDYLTTKLADRNDWWFHVKNQPGSHVVLVCRDGEDDPPEDVFTEAAMIAAYNSKAKDGVMVPVDYMKVRQVKKPAGSKPGLVIYHTNWSCYVTPDEAKVKAMRRK